MLSHLIRHCGMALREFSWQAGYGTFSLMLFKKMVGFQNLLSFREGSEKTALHLS